MNKLQRFAETYAPKPPAELLTEGHESATTTGRRIAYVTPPGKYIVLHAHWLDEHNAKRLLAWLKDLLDEEDEELLDKKCVVRWDDEGYGCWKTMCNYILPMRPDSQFCSYCGGRRKVEEPTL